MPEKVVISLRRKVPTPSPGSAAAEELRRTYEQFIRAVDPGSAGESELQPGESIRSVKQRLRRAATRLGVELQILDAGNKVIFVHSLHQVGPPRKPQSNGPLNEERLRSILSEPLGTPIHLTREQAIAVVDAGIGGRPDLPSGDEYVRKIAKVWRGLRPRG